jgi:hypothetical protein
MQLPKFTQENVLSLLCFDEVNCLLVRNAITTDLFDYPYDKVVEKAIGYIDRYKIPPQDHIADEIESLLAGEEGQKYREILTSIYSVKETLNSSYVIDKLTQFIRDRRFEGALYDAAQLQLKGKLDEAEDVIRTSLNTNLQLFDPGIKLSDLGLLSKSINDEDIFPTGVRALDQMMVGPARKQVFVILAPKSKGKSWALIQLGKTNILLNKKVCHITLEISKEIALQRYVQAFLGITRWQLGQVKTPIFLRDANGKINSLEQVSLHDRPSLEDPDIIERVEIEWNKIGPRIERNIRIKEFPTGQLTMAQLRAYLEGLEVTENFIPDILILDHAAHMKLNRSASDDFRISIGGIYVDLRGLAVERNMAVATAHQINREGSKAKFTVGEHVAEDWSMMGTVDTAVIFNQRKLEAKYKIARLYVDRGRSMKSNFLVLMAQNYDLGQFCLDSELCPEDYEPDAGIEGMDGGILALPGD